MNNLCFYNPRPKCEFKIRGECHKYVDEPIPIGHLGGTIIPSSWRRLKAKSNFIGEPRLGIGCCEYILMRDAQKQRWHKQLIGGLTVHDIPSALEQMK